ncbi:MAG: hypothetical protein RBT68_13475 [Spirochaetia bacterium]|jgi:hypothetical protein|nr:hypothetical protein [Spirochaetia bacterium]
MKRFVFTLVLLIVTSLTVFMFGWVSLRLEPGRHAVMVSKTGGVDPAVLRSGTFRWTAAALLPTNLKIIPFTLSDVERVVELGGTLPSAEVYQEFMAGKPDFNWTVSVRIRTTVLPDSLPALVEGFGMDDDAGLSAWLANTTDLAVTGLRSAIISLAGTREGAASLISGEAEAELKASIEESYPDLSVSSLTVVSAKVPDLALYESARSLYLGYMENYRASVEPALTRASSMAAEEQVRMEILRRYGDLLEQYPDLIDYLAIEAGIPPRERAMVQTFLPTAYAAADPALTRESVPESVPEPAPSTTTEGESPDAGRP